MENQTRLTSTWFLRMNSTAITKPSHVMQQDSSYSTKTILLVCALCLIMIVGIIGNSCVCYVFGWKLRGDRSIPERLFLYLGIVDLLSSIVNPATYLYFELTKYKRWDFGIIGCRIMVPFGPISTLVSASIIQIITIDRYFIIVKPFGRTYGSRCINISVIIAIFASVAFYIYYIDALTVPPGKTCIVKDVTDKGYSIPVVVFLLLQDITFLYIIIFTNAAIYFELRKKDVLSTCETGGQQSVKRKRKLFRMLIMMAFVFIILILPRDLFQLAFTFSWMGAIGIKYDKSLIQLNTVLKILYISNSCVNVFIYSKMHSRFRRSQKNLFLSCTRWLCRSNTDERLKFLSHTVDDADATKLSGLLSDKSEPNYSKC